VRGEALWPSENWFEAARQPRIRPIERFREIIAQPNFGGTIDTRQHVWLIDFTISLVVHTIIDEARCP
jgi:hypothetical protein